MDSYLMCVTTDCNEMCKLISFSELCLYVKYFSVFATFCIFQPPIGMTSPIAL